MGSSDQFYTRPPANFFPLVKPDGATAHEIQQKDLLLASLIPIGRLSVLLIQTPTKMPPPASQKPPVTQPKIKIGNAPNNNPQNQPKPNDNQTPPSPKVHSKYEDGTIVYERQQPPRLGEKPADPSGYDQTDLRIDQINNRIYQGRTFNAKGDRVVDNDFTSPTYPSGNARPDHLPPPHKHYWKPNPQGGGSPTRGKGEPF